MGSSISQKIKERISRIESGKLFAINDFFDMDNDELVTRTLSRLQSDGVISRVAAGIYMNPKHTQFGVLYPTIRANRPKDCRARQGTNYAHR
jgi:hypothetical protein